MGDSETIEIMKEQIGHCSECDFETGEPCLNHDLKVTDVWMENNSHLEPFPEEEISMAGPEDFSISC